MEMLGIIITILVGFISIIVSIWINVIQLRLKIEFLKEPEEDENGVWEYQIRVKNIGLRPIKPGNKRGLLLDFKEKVNVLSVKIKTKIPDLKKIKHEVLEEDIHSISKLFFPFEFLNRKDYFDIQLKVKIKETPKPEFSMRIPNINKGIWTPRYRLRKRCRLFFGNLLFYAGVSFSFIILFIIFILEMINGEIIRNFVNNSTNIIIFVIIYVIVHYGFTIIGFKLKE